MAHNDIRDATFYTLPNCTEQNRKKLRGETDSKLKLCTDVGINYVGVI